MTGREWWRRACDRARGGPLAWQDVDAWRELSYPDRDRIERRAKQGADHADPGIRAVGQRILEDIVVAGMGEDAPPLSRHLLLELAAVQAGLGLTDGAPVPRCGCEHCTGIPAARRSSLPRHDRNRDLDLDAARRIPILSVAAQLRLGTPRRIGRDYLTRCPMHHDKRPSCRLNTDKNLWYCDVCATGGDGILLVMKAMGVDFVTAVRELAGSRAA
jgi:hypothetical protein